MGYEKGKGGYDYSANGFRDEELFLPKEILEKTGIQVVVASKLSSGKKRWRAMVNPDTAIADIKADDFDAVIFVGGNGSSQYWDDPVAHSLARMPF